MNSTRTNHHNGRRKESRVVLAQNLPRLPNWLPLSSCEPARVEFNLAALLSTAQRLYGKDYPEWLNSLDNQYGDRLARVQEANLWPEQESPRGRSLRATAGPLLRGSSGSARVERAPCRF